jgi:predicted  nucleic acid-binding Zn-ribbon protein
MKIKFSEEHKDKLLYYIKEYQKISNEEKQIYNKVKTLQDELNGLTAKLQNAENNLQTIRDEEKKYMDELHEIYGDFSLNDLWETINN